MVDEVFKKGIPVIVVDRNILSKNYSAFIGADNYKIRWDAGVYANSILKGSGNVMEIDGPDLGSSADIGRHNGFVDYIKKNTSLKYISRFSGNWDKLPAESDKKFRDTILSLPGIQLIFAQNDRLALGAIRVCQKTGIDKKIKFIGVDGLPGANGGIDLVEKKMMNATILYPSGGVEAIQTAVNILENKPFEKEIELSTTVIDSTNVRIMRLQTEEVLSQQEEIDKRQKKIDEQIIISKNQTNIIAGISLTLALALIFGAILLYYLKENKKINKRLEVQNKEIADQRNQLIEMGEQAEAAHQAKLNFFTNISHEFRTPLTLILSPMEELLMNGKLQIGTKNTLQLIQRNVMRLYRLVNQLMDFRKIEFSKMKLKTTEHDLVAFAKEITDSYGVLAKNKHISLQFFTTERTMNVWFDHTKIDKVIFNLLSNAFKFTKDNGYIHVTVSSTKDNAIIKVEDNGVGMTKDAIDHAFDPFFQGEYENYKGTGLGLALSKEFIEMHHGGIAVKSEKWKGTQFEISLPLGTGHFEENEIIPSSETNISILEDSKIYTTELLNTSEDYRNDAAENGTNRPCILIVEDNDDLRAYLKSKLNQNFDTLEAENGNIALQLAFENIPDLIISDVVLPGKNGLEITQLLKKDVRTAHIPVILLTARSSDQQRLEGLETQADAYLTKPFNLQLLEQTIKNLVVNRDKVKGHYSGEAFTEEKSQAAKKTDRKFISEFSAIVENNIGNDQFGVDDICKEMSISRVQLYRKVKALLNCNVNDYIVTTRLQKAKYYLQHEELSMSEIAFKTGFASSAYFSTLFKSKFGYTPSEYKAGKAS